MKSRFLLSLLLILAAGSAALALTKTISQSGNWSSPSTWGGNPIPSAGDDVIISGGFSVSVDVPNATCLSVQLGGSVLGTGTGTLTFTGGSQLTVLGVVNVGPFNNNGTAGSLSMAGGGTLLCDGLIVGRLGTWTAGTGTIVFTATNSIPNDNNVDFNNLTVSGGTTTLTRNVTVAGDLVIGTGATLNGGANTLTFSGNWTNNGTFSGNTGTVTFSRNGNQTIAGTGINNFNLVRVNMGTSIGNTLEVVASQFNAPDAFLTITNGTFKMSGTFAFSNSFFVGPIYNIQPTSGFWVNNPNVTVTPQAGGISVRGLLRLTAGTYNVGTAVDHSLDYVAGSTIIVEGGTLTIAGRLTRNNATATTAYTQSSGTVTVVAQGSTDPVFGGFDLGAVGSSFTMSGGTIVVRNATSAPADFVNASSVANVTGGTLQIGDASTANGQVIRIQSARPIGNLFVSNATAQATKPTAQLLSSATIVGDLTLQPGTTLNANGLNISVGGNWLDNGTFTTGGNSVTFNGSGAQSIARTGGETFNSLVVSKSGGVLTLNNSVTVGNLFSLSSGTVAVGSSTLLLNGTVSGGGVLTSGSAGTVSYAQSSDGQAILAGTYGNLTFSNFNKVLPTSGTIGVAGLFDAGSATGHTVTGSSFDFNGGGQTIPPFSYNNLTLSGSGIKTGSGNLTVAGTLTNNAGVTFTGATTLNLNGSAHLNSGTITSGTIVVGSGATLTNGGVITAGSALSGAGTLVQGNGSTLNIGGLANIAVLNAAAAGNTVNYAGVAQTVAPVVYQNLTLSGSGSPVLSSVASVGGNLTLSGGVTALAAGGMTIGGNLVVGTGTVFNAGSFAHTLAGNLINSGSFLAGSGGFSFNGVSPQSVGNVAFNNVVVNNATGVSLSGDVTIGGTLSLTGGALSIGSHTLTLNGSLAIGGGTMAGGASSGLVVGGSGTGVSLPALSLNTLTLGRAGTDSLGGDLTISGVLSLTNGSLITGTHSVVLASTGSLSENAGHTVIGNVRTTRTVAATSGAETFGNIGIELLLNGTAPGLTTVLRKTGTASTGNGHNSIKRYFDITPATNTGLNAGLVYHFDSSEINGQDVNTLELYRSGDNGATWSNLIGSINPAAGTLTVSGVNDLSRWTAADSANSIGNTVTPVLASISPTSGSAGDPAFTLTVHGSDFLSGKSSVRLNGVAKVTTFVNSTQLTASVPAGDLLTVGTFPVTVFNAGGGGSSSAQTFTVNPGAPTIVRVETAADGGGTIVPAQSMVSGNSITVYAVSRDNLNNFVANVAATSWTLGNVTGGVGAGDLVPSSDGKSAVFTGHAVGSADIRAISGTLQTTASGIISVTAGSASVVRVESAANGSGTIIPAQAIASGSSIIGYAITRDASNNFVSNVAATSWALGNVTGGVVTGDLIPALDGKSVVFTGHVAGGADIRVTSGTLTSSPSGIITVTAGAAAAIRVETAANGSGTVVPAQGIASGDSIRGYAITRDASNNFVANVAATSWALGNVTGGVVAGDLHSAPDGRSAVFTGHVAGSADIRVISGALPSTASGILTVAAGSAAIVRVETAANGSGTILPAQALSSGSAVTGYAITRDASNNFVANVAATGWSLENVTGGIVPSDLVPSTDQKSATFTGRLTGTGDIRALSGVVVATPSGMITVIPGAASGVRVETASDGSGIVVPSQSVNSGSSLTVYSISRDASGNFVTNVAADQWGMQNVSGGVVQGDLVPSIDRKNAVFTGHSAGSGNIAVVSGGLGVTASGTITVNPLTITSQVSINAGWNLISNPVTNPVAGDSVRQLYPGAISAYAFEYSGGYQQVFRMVNGRGYWERFAAASVNPIAGLPRTRDSISVAAGWNVIGTISDTVDTNAIVSIPPGLKASRWFAYAGGYSAATQLIPGKGYWVKSLAAGKFVFGNPVADRPSKVMAQSEAAIEDYNSLTITDSKGGSQTLYFGAATGDAISSVMYAMPPLPPTGAFDARFPTAEGGTMVQAFAADAKGPVEISVTIQSDAYPVTVHWRIKEAPTGFELADGAGNRFAPKQMMGENEMQITSNAVTAFVIRTTGKSVTPREFSLDQNYPNPFNPSTTIRYSLPADTRVSLKVFDILGREVATLVNGEENGGAKSVVWDGAGMASGEYFCRIQAGNFVATRRMLLLK
jgi:hypothetical protein